MSRRGMKGTRERCSACDGGGGGGDESGGWWGA